MIYFYYGKLAFSIITCCTLWSDELITDLLRGEVFLQYLIGTLCGDLLTKYSAQAILGCQPVGMPARQRNDPLPHVVCLFSLTPVKHCPKTILSQLPQIKYNWLPRWLSVHLPCQATIYLHETVYSGYLVLLDFMLCSPQLGIILVTNKTRWNSR
jgi:hypothetical protein